jgi:serine-type D-Ala-D-Ala carboxypeptidase/endopeptidase (penicillin-binding protein 4)
MWALFFSIIVFNVNLAHCLSDKELEANPFEYLKRDLREILTQVDPMAQIGVEVLRVRDGKILFEHNAQQRFIPGAAVKLLTAAAALKILGPNFCFETKLLTQGNIKEGILKGSLYVEGSGDPSLVSHSFEDLIFQLKLQNVREIEGDLVFDASEFDELPLAPGWMWDEKLEYRTAPIDALTINHSCVKLWIKPAPQNKMRPLLHLEPELAGLIIENTAVMEDIDPIKTSITVGKRDVSDKDILYVEGSMSLKNQILEFSLPVKQPLLYSATEFSVLLKKNGIKHTGKIRFAQTPQQARVLANHVSESLFHLVMYMLKNNDDLYANCFFKKMGRMNYNKPGTWPNGSQSVRDFLVSIGNKDFSDVIVLDGSGESRYNMMTPHFIASFLYTMHQNFAFSPEFIASMPMAGMDAALKKRLREQRLNGVARVIPGSLKGVSSLSGYITTEDKETLAVVIMMNGFVKAHKEVKSEIEDRICNILARFSSKL